MAHIAIQEIAVKVSEYQLWKESFKDSQIICHGMYQRIYERISLRILTEFWSSLHCLSWKNSLDAILCLSRKGYP